MTRLRRYRPNRAAPYTREQREYGAHLAELRQTNAREFYRQPYNPLFFEGLRFKFSSRAWENTEGGTLWVVRFWPEPSDTDYEILNQMRRNFERDRGRGHLLDDPEQGEVVVNFGSYPDQWRVLEGLWFVALDTHGYDRALVGLENLPEFALVAGTLLDAWEEATNLHADIDESVLKPPYEVTRAREDVARVAFAPRRVVLAPGEEAEVIDSAMVQVAADPVVGYWWVYLVHRGLEVPSDLAQGHAKYNRALTAANDFARSGETTRRRPAEPPAPTRFGGTKLSVTQNLYDGDLLAFLMNPKTLSVVAARLGTSSYRAVLTGRTPGNEEVRGAGSLDPVLLSGCARTHTPSGVEPRDQGYGTCLYTSLGALAFQGFGVSCISSTAGGRSALASKWWAEALRRQLARADGEVQIITLEDLIASGLLLWMPLSGEYEGLMAETRERLLPALLTAHLGFDQERDVERFEALLEAAGASRGEVAQALTPNRRRKPRPPMEVVEFYEWLSGLPG